MLEPILDSVRARLSELIDELDRWVGRAAGAPPVRRFDSAIRRRGLAVIAEVKRRSPSAGDIASDLDPARLAQAYEKGGAAAISVVTEPDHFGGSMGDLVAVREAVGLPILRKDFILHPVQIAQARAGGADAVLLIAAVLDDSTLGDLVTVTSGFGMVALVEAHTAGEVERAAAAGAAVIGINNRDLTTFEVNLDTSIELHQLIPPEVLSVAESGVKSRSEARRMASAGYDGILVGEAAAGAEDPAAFIADLLEGT